MDWVGRLLTGLEPWLAYLLGLMQGGPLLALGVAVLAGEWIHQASLAIQAEIPIEKHLDTVAQFPTYSEAYLEALEKLDL